MKSNALRATVAAFTLIIMISGSTATSSLFVIYRQQWGLTSADIAIVFTAYVGTLLPVLLLFGGLAERFGRRSAAAAGILSMAAGMLALTLAHGLPMLIVARLFQGLGVGVSIGAITAAFAESYRGTLPQGNALQSVTAIGLFAGPVISAIAYNLGGGLNWSFVPGLALVVALLAFTPFLAERSTDPAAAVVENPLAPDVVWRGLRFALPLVFVSWAGLSMYLSLVPSYLAAALHAVNPAIGAGAVVAAQASSLAVTMVLGGPGLQRGSVIAPVIGVAGLAVLILGTSANIWPLVVIATIMVGAGCGVASAAAIGIAGRIGRGQRSRVFARVYVAAYLGYSIPVLAIGVIAVHASLAAGFITVVVGLAIITAALPFLRVYEAKPACPRIAVAAA